MRCLIFCLLVIKPIGQNSVQTTERVIAIAAIVIATDGRKFREIFLRRNAMLAKLGYSVGFSTGEMVEQVLSSLNLSEVMAREIPVGLKSDSNGYDCDGVCDCVCDCSNCACCT